MSVSVSAAVWKFSATSGTSLLVLVSLADQANDEGWCWPSVETVAKRCRISVRTVQRILSELEGRGELLREARAGQSTRYQILTGGDIAVSGVGGDITVTPRQSVRGDIAMSRRGDTGVTQKRKEPSIDKDSLRSSLSARPRATRLNPDWIPEPELIAEMRAECPTIDLQAEHRKFVDYWCSKSGKDATKIDWARTWRNWIRNAKPTNGNGYNRYTLKRQEETDQHFARMLEEAREIDRQREAQAKEITQ